ncbi:MAG: hypothetical protein ACWA41_06790 [Putridiphycobacter sp.]
MTRKIITSYQKLPIEVKKALNNTYPDGVDDEIQLIPNAFTGTSFKGIFYEYNDVVYLIKYDSQINNIAISDDEDEDDVDTDNDDLIDLESE